MRYNIMIYTSRTEQKRNVPFLRGRQHITWTLFDHLKEYSLYLCDCFFSEKLFNRKMQQEANFDNRKGQMISGDNKLTCKYDVQTIT
jgi:hypothetical protein